MAPKLNTSSPTNESILAVWAPVEHAVLYTLVIIREGSYVRNKVNTTNTEVTFDNLQSGTSYCIKSMAWDAEGRIGDDMTVCQITRPSSPDVVDIQVTQGRAPGIEIYWVSVQGAYKIHSLELFGPKLFHGKHQL
ncbi:Fibronectin type III domain-containing protein 7 [Oryzias melastigma]|uniref:Fibronectin type III domain-containing protein 7 n=1 Tax=Oryzias melastigma TaxID=30732 RepID=A0A834CKK0_ORYME|nr:Fibronectin type III domain-containing protein 7 [Oryzias melastigma]